MRIIDGIPFYKTLPTAKRAGERESKRLKTFSYKVWNWGGEYALFTTDAQVVAFEAKAEFDWRRDTTQYFTYNNAQDEAK